MVVPLVVPLVVVTGFLGAGKTTLVNRLLARRQQAEQAGRLSAGKLGVIVNELGEVGIDGSLLGGEATRQVELPGGCVCCALGDELGTTLLELVARNPELEAIVLETTGVAEPLPITWAVARPPVASRVRVAAVVTLVDVTNFLASRQVSASVDAQVAYADVLLMTKAALAEAERGPDGAGVDVVTQVEAAARHLAPRALVRRGTVDDHAAWLEALLADPPLSGELPSPDGQAPALDSHHVHTDECRHLDSHTAHGIDSVWVPVGPAMDVEELCDQLAELPSNYVRIKGIVRDAAGGWVVVHRVGPRVSSEPLGAGQPQDFEQGRIVALGPSVVREALARCVELAAS
ncbi:MAG TPA: GTP-binding protein [Kofleriaceae bacterium]|nr:GTP-binding protein [Kofleriaceae bacterium]